MQVKDLHFFAFANFLENLASGSFANTQPALSSMATERLGATICPNFGMNFDRLFEHCVFDGRYCHGFGTFYAILPLNTLHKAIHMVVMATVPTATLRLIRAGRYLRRRPHESGDNGMVFRFLVFCHCLVLV